jgi:hypothetical protein
MQTSKFLLVIGASIVLTAPHLLAAKPETEAQARMREALRLKMEELNAQSAPATAAPVEATPTETPATGTTIVVPVPVEQPVVQPVEQPVVTTAAPTVSAAPDADAAKAEQMRQALQQKMAELDSQTPTTQTLAPEVVPAAKPKKPAKPAVIVEKPAAPAAPVLDQAPANPVFSPTPIEAPASPLPVTKQDRLADLLRRYKADQISAADYHSQRAAVIAEP